MLLPARAKRRGTSDGSALHERIPMSHLCEHGKAVCGGVVHDLMREGPLRPPVPSCRAGLRWRPAREGA